MKRRIRSRRHRHGPPSVSHGRRRAVVVERGTGGLRGRRRIVNATRAGSRRVVARRLRLGRVALRSGRGTAHKRLDLLAPRDRDGPPLAVALASAWLIPVVRMLLRVVQTLLLRLLLVRRFLLNRERLPGLGSSLGERLFRRRWVAPVGLRVLARVLGAEDDEGVRGSRDPRWIPLAVPLSSTLGGGARMRVSMIIWLTLHVRERWRCCAGR